jgi:branched-chain amino acid transport system ATP-binding protein
LAEGSYQEVSNNPLVVEAYMGSHGGDTIWATWRWRLKT